jgi:hypothetical protein
LYSDVLPHDVIDAPKLQLGTVKDVGPGVDIVSVSSTGTATFNSNSYYVTPSLNNNNVKNIMTRMAILFDGQYREVDLNSGIYNYIEKYRCSKGLSDNGLYSYSYSIETSPFELQPSGAINLSRFKTIEFEISTILPNISTEALFSVACDAEGTVIGTTKTDIIYDHTFDLYFIEERYNMLRFVGGHVGLVYAR